MVTMRLPATAPTFVMHDFIGHAVHQYGAGGALAFAAAVLGAGKIQVVAQDAEQRALGVGIDPPPPAVDKQFGDPGHVPLLSKLAGESACLALSAFNLLKVTF